MVRTILACVVRYDNHSRDDRLWLDRLELRLDDGELAVLNLDQYSVIEAL